MPVSATAISTWLVGFARTETLIQRLEIEEATLRSPLRVEQRARQLGLTVPARDQVRHAREFVSGTTGLAAAQRNRVAELNERTTTR